MPGIRRRPWQRWACASSTIPSSTRPPLPSGAWSTRSATWGWGSWLGERGVKLHQLSPAKGSRRPRKRVGRGQGAGQGKTSRHGQKGQGSRSSVGLPTGFEGGQMPLKQRLPKLRGFHNRWRHEYVVVNLGKLMRFEKDTVVD